MDSLTVLKVETEFQPISKPHIPRFWQRQLAVKCPQCGKILKGSGIRKAIACLRCGGDL
jgi:hypothetical protein